MKLILTMFHAQPTIVPDDCRLWRLRKLQSTQYAPHASTDDRHAEITMYRLSNRNATFINIAIVYTFDSV